MSNSEETQPTQKTKTPTQDKSNPIQVGLWILMIIAIICNGIWTIFLYKQDCHTALLKEHSISTGWINTYSDPVAFKKIKHSEMSFLSKGKEIRVGMTFSELTTDSTSHVFSHAIRIVRSKKGVNDAKPVVLGSVHYGYEIIAGSKKVTVGKEEKKGTSGFFSVDRPAKGEWVYWVEAQGWTKDKILFSGKLQIKRN